MHLSSELGSAIAVPSRSHHQRQAARKLEEACSSVLVRYFFEQIQEAMAKTTRDLQGHSINSDLPNGFRTHTIVNLEFGL